jgi:hypothetical protein
MTLPATVLSRSGEIYSWGEIGEFCLSELRSGSRKRGVLLAVGRLQRLRMTLSGRWAQRRI